MSVRWRSGRSPPERAGATDAPDVTRPVYGIEKEI
jgi:hypothetical protein